MTQTVQMVRLTPAAMGAYTGPIGQLVVNTSTFGIHVQDGITAGGSATLMSGNNLSDLPDKVQARSNLGLGTAALSASTAFDAAGAATAAQAAAVALSVQRASNGSDFASASTTRTNLGLAIGADVQAFNAILAGLVSAGGGANNVPYYTGASAWALQASTAYGRGVLNLANAAAAQTLFACPSTTGAGASGSWGINITGSSASCTGNAATATTAAACSGNSATATTATNLSGGTVAASTITATGDITAFFSDDRLKNRVSRVENALEKLCTLPVFYYRPNAKAIALGVEDRVRIGTSAQAVQRIAPDMIRPAPIDPEYLTYQDQQMIPLIIAAIQDLRAEIRAIKEGK